MYCSIVNGRVQLFLQDSGTSISMSAGSGAAEDGDDGAGLSHSALQRPEVSRAQLAALLRKVLKKQKSGKSQQTYWTAFLTNYVRQNANSNDS